MLGFINRFRCFDFLAICGWLAFVFFLIEIRLTFIDAYIHMNNAFAFPGTVFVFMLIFNFLLYSAFVLISILIFLIEKFLIKRCKTQTPSKKYLIFKFLGISFVIIPLILIVLFFIFVINRVLSLILFYIAISLFVILYYFYSQKKK